MIAGERGLLAGIFILFVLFIIGCQPSDDQKVQQELAELGDEELIALTDDTTALAGQPTMMDRTPNLRRLPSPARQKYISKELALRLRSRPRLELVTEEKTETMRMEEIEAVVKSS